MNNNEFQRIEETIKEQYTNITGIVVLKNKMVMYENYFNDYKKDDTIHIASVTKSIISILIGIAIDKSYINTIDQLVLDFFPYYVPKRGEKTIQKITIRDLLTMRAPYKYKYEPYTKVYASDDWTKEALNLLGGKGTIGDFKYSTVGMQILAKILVKATGKSVLEFASEHLFNPLGINTPKNMTINNKDEHIAFLKNKSVSGWIIDPKGVNTAGWGLTLTPNDMAKIGQLYLNKGLWNKKLIISSKWILDSTNESSRWGEHPYGYLWWIIESPECKGYAAIGDGGNIIFVCPQKHLVVAIASSFMPRAKDRIEFIKKYLLPIV